MLASFHCPFSEQTGWGIMILGAVGRIRRAAPAGVRPPLAIGKVVCQVLRCSEGRNRRGPCSRGASSTRGGVQKTRYTARYTLGERSREL